MLPGSKMMTLDRSENIKISGVDMSSWWRTKNWGLFAIPATVSCESTAVNVDHDGKLGLVRALQTGGVHVQV